MPLLFEENQKIIPELDSKEKIFLKYFNSKFNVSDISSYHYQGVIAGSELNTYNANTLYIALLMQFNPAIAVNVNRSIISLYDELNVLIQDGGNNVSYFDVVLGSEKYIAGAFNMKNVLFSRIVPTFLTYVTFQGYKATIIT